MGKGALSRALYLPPTPIFSSIHKTAPLKSFNLFNQTLFFGTLWNLRWVVASHYLRIYNNLVICVGKRNTHEVACPVFNLCHAEYINMQCLLLIFSQSDYLIQFADVFILDAKQCRSKLLGFFRIKLIWINTVCKRWSISRFGWARIKTFQKCRLFWEQIISCKYSLQWEGTQNTSKSELFPLKVYLFPSNTMVKKNKECRVKEYRDSNYLLMMTVLYMDMKIMRPVKNKICTFCHTGTLVW